MGQHPRSAKVQGLLFHHLRRTAARNLRRWSCRRRDYEDWRLENAERVRALRHSARTGICSWRSIPSICSIGRTWMRSSRFTAHPTLLAGCRGTTRMALRTQQTEPSAHRGLRSTRGSFSFRRNWCSRKGASRRSRVCRACDTRRVCPSSDGVLSHR